MRTLKNRLIDLKRNVADAHAYINPNKKDHLKSELNSYYNQRRFTSAIEKDHCISFLDISIRRLNNAKLEANMI